MVTPRHPLFTVPLILAIAATLCQCKTSRTVKSTRSSFTFDEKMWGGQGGGGEDTQEIRSKFAERGYTIAEDGTIKADKPDLYKDKRPRGLDGDFQTKTARFDKMEAETKAFKTPEYLKRQEYAGIANARENGMTAREGNSTRTPDRAAGKLFDKKAKDSTDLATFGTSTHRDAENTFATSADRDASAVTEAPRAIGTPRKAGYQDNVAMSMDDVKKMLNPEAYARGTGITE